MTVPANVTFVGSLPQGGEEVQDYNCHSSLAIMIPRETVSIGRATAAPSGSPELKLSVVHLAVVDSSI